MSNQRLWKGNRGDDVSVAPSGGRSPTFQASAGDYRNRQHRRRTADWPSRAAELRVAVQAADDTPRYNVTVIDDGATEVGDSDRDYLWEEVRSQAEHLAEVRGSAAAQGLLHGRGHGHADNQGRIRPMVDRPRENEAAEDG
jgi:hypothetical protein